MSATDGPAIVLSSDDAFSRALITLEEIDPAGVGAMRRWAGPPAQRRCSPDFAGLASIIVAQQVSTASADAIRSRLALALDPLTASSLLGAGDGLLRDCGLSRQKIATLQAVAGAVEQAALPFESMMQGPADRARAALLAIRGIGPWTADVFLLFGLGHADAWPVGDIALQEAARLVFGGSRPDAATLTTIGERWRPLRGVAATWLWACYRAAKTGPVPQDRQT